MNKSNQDIPELVFPRGNQEMDTISLAARDTSPTYDWNNQKIWQEYVSEPFMMFKVNMLPDNQNNSNFHAGMISRSEFKKEELNEILIHYDSDSEKFKFNLKN